MKKLLYLAVFAPCLAYTQPNFESVVAATRQSNPTMLANSFDASVELTIQGSDGIYSKDEASKLLGDFFAKNKPSECALVHSGSARDGQSYYCIGSLVAGGKKFRLYALFKQVQGKYLIQEMRFEQG